MKRISMQFTRDGDPSITVSRSVGFFKSLMGFERIETWVKEGAFWINDLDRSRPDPMTALELDCVLETYRVR